MHLPSGGMQPVTCNGPDDTVHLAWLQGDPKGADVYYQALPAGVTNGSAPIRVNSTTDTGIAVGTVRGVTVALGRKSAVHIVWNGSSAAAMDSKQGSPVFYSHLGADRKSFQKPVNLSGRTANLDGGASVAADREGRVFVVWHAQPIAETGGEAQRRVFLAASSDDGETFQPERVVSLENGVCGCCGLRAFSGPEGQLFILYRAALSATDRPMRLIVSRDHGLTFQPVLTDAWESGGCPMSTSASFSAAGQTVAAWETRSEIKLAYLESVKVSRSLIISEGDGNKHPALAINSRGESLCAWAAGTGWGHGGAVKWRLLGANGTPAGPILQQDGLSVWNFPAALARPDGTFVIVY